MTEPESDTTPAGAPSLSATPPNPLPRDGDEPRTPALRREATRVGAPGAAFPVVALGGSAGARVAFEQFLRAMPMGTGMAFVVITHLSSDQGSDLAQVLQHFTAMPVQEAADGLQVRPNQVYVIPSNRYMSMLHGKLLLFAPTHAPGRWLPIDFFFQSLAKDARERAVCIICSGLGSDGTLGLKMVMENFGMVMVQDPATAEFDSMPRAALATEFVDYVLPAGELPAHLLEYVRHPPHRPRGNEDDPGQTKPAHALQKVFHLIRAQTGHDFSFYKRNTVFRRIERRMNAHQITDFTHYVRFLQETPAEVAALFKELLIGVTKFFRDREAFEQLQLQLLPLLRHKPDGSTVRVWAPGCSTGEEAYSLAIVLLEALDGAERGKHLSLQIFATDINPDAIDTARTGEYADSLAADVSPERWHRFCIKTDCGYRVKKEVRDAVVFAVHDLNKDAPFTKLDVLVCRNLLIYFSAELQKKLIPIFHYALNPGGLLLLGPSENLTGFQDLFQPLDVKWKLSRRTELPSSSTRLTNFLFSMGRQPLSPPPTTLPSPVLPVITPKEGPFAALVQRQYAPRAVVLNAQVHALEKELQYTRHRLQTTIEEMESSLKKLKSANEEAMTNKEEMQSLDEELS